MVSAAEAARRGLIPHSSGLYIDLERFKALPDASQFQKIAPATGVVIVANNPIKGWFIGWVTDHVSNTLCMGMSTFNPAFKEVFESGSPGANCLSWMACGFTDTDLPMKSDIIPMEAMVSPARLALERYRQRLDGVLS